MPEDFFSALNEAAEITGDQATVELDASTQLYLLEFNMITKTGGINSPFVTIEWPGIQIPQIIANNLLDKSLKCTFITATGDSEDHLLTFYEGNPAWLDFTKRKKEKKWLQHPLKRCTTRRMY